MNFSRKEPRGGQRGTWGRGKIRTIALKIRAMSQYGGGRGGGGFVDKKKFRQAPLFIIVFNVKSSFLKKYCTI